MKQRGKVTAAWEKTRREWIKANPPNFEGYYICYICKRWIPADEITVDHVMSRSRRPDLVTDQSNLEPCCGLCNTEKGSS